MMRYVNSFAIIVQCIEIKVVQHHWRYHKLKTVVSVFIIFYKIIYTNDYTCTLNYVLNLLKHLN